MRILAVDDLRQLVENAREQRGLTQSRAAGLVGYSQKSLSDFERGRDNPPIDMVLNIMTVLGIRLDADLTAGSRDHASDEEPSL